MNFKLSHFAIIAFCCVCGCSRAKIDQAKDTHSKAQRLANAASKAIVDGDHKTGEALINDALALDPVFCEAWVGIGMLKLRREDISGAKAAYEEALACHHTKDSSASSYHLLQQVFILRLLRRDSEAISIYAEANRRFPGDAAVEKFRSILTLDLDLPNSNKIALPKEPDV